MLYEVIPAIRNRNVNRFILRSAGTTTTTTTTTSRTTGNWQRSHENFDLKVSTRFLFNTQPQQADKLAWHSTSFHATSQPQASSLGSRVSRLGSQVSQVSQASTNFSFATHSKRQAGSGRQPASSPIPDSFPKSTCLLPPAIPLRLLSLPSLLRLPSLHWVIKSCASVYWERERDCVEEQLSLSSY